MIGDKLVIEDWHLRAARGIMRLLFPQIMNTPGRFIIAIAGESGSGKSEIATVLRELLNERAITCVILQQDDYFFYPPQTNDRIRRQNISHVGPSEVRLGLLDQHLGDILEGKNEIVKPLVIFDEDTVSNITVHIEEVKVVIVDGAYTTLLRNVHQRIFIHLTYADTRQIRSYRAREKQDEYLERILEIEHRILSAHKARADIVITETSQVKQARIIEEADTKPVQAA